MGISESCDGGHMLLGSDRPSGETQSDASAVSGSKPKKSGILTGIICWNRTTRSDAATPQSCGAPSARWPRLSAPRLARAAHVPHLVARQSDHQEPDDDEIYRRRR